MDKNLQVVKIGASSIIKDKKVDQAILKNIARDVNRFNKEGTHSILVVSGSIKLGMNVLGYKRQPNKNIKALQRCACVGQKELMKEYDRAFEMYKVVTSQLLVTYHNLEDSDQEKNIEERIKDDVEHDIITLINYNDGIDDSGIRLYDSRGKLIIRDNDALAAQVAIYAGASRLIILTNSNGKGTMGSRKTKKDTIKLSEKNGIEVIVGECDKRLYNIVTKKQENYRTHRNI